MTNLIRRDELEKAFLESEDRFRDLVEGSIEGIMIHRDFKPLFVNGTYAEIFGFDSPEEVMALDWVLELAAPHVQARAMGYAAAGLRGDDALTDYEYEGLRKDGSTIWLDNRVRVISWQGEPAIQSTVVDITERKRAEEALLQSEKKFRNLAEGSKQGLCIHRGWTPVFTNQAFADIYGFDNPEQVIASGSIEPFYAAHEIDRLLGYRAKRLKGEEAPEWYVCESRRRDGAVIWTEHSVRMIDWDGEPAVQCTVADITERKRAEEALLQAQDELLKKVRLATLGQLTATVSHELRNPLGVIQTSSFIVRDGLDGATPRVQRALERIDRSVVRCDRIIDELLDFTRIQDLEPEATAINVWLGDLLDEQPLPEGVKLCREFGAPEASVSFDHDRFRRAVINVFENACQAIIGKGDERAGLGKGVLTVTTRKTDGRVEVVFEDSGPGIAPDVLPRIFEPLFSTKGFGVGLGMPVVKQIMEQHGGGIEIETEEDRGTKVCLWLDTKARTVGATA